MFCARLSVDTGREAFQFSFFSPFLAVGSLLAPSEAISVWRCVASIQVTLQQSLELYVKN